MIRVLVLLFLLSGSAYSLPFDLQGRVQVGQELNLIEKEGETKSESDVYAHLKKVWPFEIRSSVEDCLPYSNVCAVTMPGYKILMDLKFSVASSWSHSSHEFNEVKYRIEFGVDF